MYIYKWSVEAVEEIIICNSLASLRKAKDYTQIELSNLTNLSQ